MVQLQHCISAWLAIIPQSAKHRVQGISKRLGAARDEPSKVPALDAVAIATWRDTRSAFRVNDIVFTETFGTEKEAVEQARAWFEARLTNVTVTDDEREYTFRDFAAKIASNPSPK